jgi:hypothetical protein
MAEPIDHLHGKSGYTHELLMELTDEQLEETAAYWAKRTSEYAAIQPPTKGYSGSAYAHWWCTKKQSAIHAERERRHHDGWSTQFTTEHVCRVCGERATVIEDDGWACDTHRATHVDQSSSRQNAPD